MAAAAGPVSATAPVSPFRACKERATNRLVVILIIGLIAGWLSGKIMGGGFGLIGDIVGGWLWMTLHLPVFGPWWLMAIVCASSAPASFCSSCG